MTRATDIDGTSWLTGFQDRLLAPAARDFARWAASLAGSGAVLDRDRFGPEDLLAWLGNITIIRWDAAAGDYSYRLFGSHLPEVLGRDLTGQTLAAWPPKLASIKRDRLHTVVSRRVPLCAQTVTLRLDGTAAKRGYAVLEQVMWPLRHGSDAPDAVLDLTVPVPEEAGVNARTLQEQTGRLNRWFAADGGPLATHPGAGGPG